MSQGDADQESADAGGNRQRNGRRDRQEARPASADAALVLHSQGGEQRGGGERLGPVGATLIAEVFVGLVHGDHKSYLWLKGKNWKPTLPSKTPGDFTMADLLRFVGDISPIDGITTV